MFFASKGGVARSVGNGPGALLTDEEENDNRCRSVSAAVQFAKSNNLLGVILNALVLVSHDSLMWTSFPDNYIVSNEYLP